MNLNSLLFKKISTSFSLILIGILAFSVGFYTINQAQKLKQLQKPFYISIEKEEVRPLQN